MKDRRGKKIISPLDTLFKHVDWAMERVSKIDRARLKLPEGLVLPKSRRGVAGRWAKTRPGVR